MKIVKLFKWGFNMGSIGVAWNHVHVIAVHRGAYMKVGKVGLNVVTNMTTATFE